MPNVTKHKNFYLPWGLVTSAKSISIITMGVTGERRLGKTHRLLISS